MIIHGQDFHFYPEMECRAADKTLEQYFLKEFKAACKNSGEFELKQQNGSDMHLGRLCSQPFNYTIFQLQSIHSKVAQSFTKNMLVEARQM